MGINLADLPLKLLMPSFFDNTREIAFKTIRSVSKLMHGLEIGKVRTLNMQGKKKMRRGQLVASPNYKKAYITLKNPISISSYFCPADATRRTNQADKGKLLQGR